MTNELIGVNVDGMVRYSYDCPFCSYCLWIYVQPLTGKLIKIEKGEEKIKEEKTPHFKAMDDYENLRHEHIIKELKLMKENKIKEYNRGSITINKNGKKNGNNNKKRK